MSSSAYVYIAFNKEDELIGYFSKLAFAHYKVDGCRRYTNLKTDLIQKERNSQDYEVVFKDDGKKVGRIRRERMDRL